jgi:FlaA1/EpsC-like NDP-sugar epimerase
MRGKGEFVYTGLLLFTDVAMIALAFVFSYFLRLWTEQLTSADIGTLRDYLAVLVIQVPTLVAVFFFSRLYHRQRGMSHVDEFYSVFVAVSVGTIMSVAFNAFLIRNGPDYSRRMIVFNWALTIVLVTLGRLVYSRFKWALQSHGVGAARVIIVGTGETGRMVLRAIQRSPGLGYELVGMVQHDSQLEDLGVPVLGSTEELS